MNQKKIEFLKFIRRKDWHSFQKSLCHKKLLIIALFVNKLWNCQCSACKSLWLTVDLDVPFVPFLHVEELLHHASDSIDLLLWSLSDFSKKSSHGVRIIFDCIRDTINQTELSWDENTLSDVPDLYHWLSLVRDLPFISLEEVLGNRGLLSIPGHKELSARRLLEVDVLHNVGLLRAVVGNDTLVDKLFSAANLSSLTTILFKDLFDSVEDCLVAHESGTTVDDNVATRLVLVSCGLKALPDLHVDIFYDLRIRAIEEPWSMADLNHTSLSHSLLQDNIEKLLVAKVALTIRIVNVSSVDNKLALMIDLKSDLASHVS